MSPDKLVVAGGISDLIFLWPNRATAASFWARQETSSAVLAKLRSGIHEPLAFAQLQRVHAWVVPGIAVPAAYGRMAEQVAEAAAQGKVHVYQARDSLLGRLARLFPSAADIDDRAVPFVGDDGKPVLSVTGTPMQRPAGLDPHFFVDQGLADGKLETDMLQREGGGPGVLGYAAGQLAKFKQGGPWDAQRAGGRFHPEFVNYATVIIGLYAAASGSSRQEILSIENGYAALFSRYAQHPEMDRTYTHLPRLNVQNTEIGFQLYEQKRLRPSPVSLTKP